MQCNLTVECIVSIFGVEYFTFVSKMEAVGFASIFVLTKLHGITSQKTGIQICEFHNIFSQKGSPINYGNFCFRMKLYWRFLGTWACFHCADVLKWADIFMIWLQTLSCTWSSIWRLVQLSDWCASSWTDWLFQHKNQHSSLYLQNLILESSPLLLSCPLLYSVCVILFGFLWDFTV